MLKLILVDFLLLLTQVKERSHIKEEVI